MKFRDFRTFVSLPGVPWSCCGMGGARRLLPGLGALALEPLCPLRGANSDADEWAGYVVAKNC